MTKREAEARSDLFLILDAAPHEAAIVLAALHEGMIDGRTYAGVYKDGCRCIIGTIADARGIVDFVSRDDVGIREYTDDLERWLFRVLPGCTPANNRHSRLAAQWINEWATDRYGMPIDTQAEVKR